MTRIGVAGLGRMGAPMAANLVEAGFAVALWNRSRDRAEAVAAATGASLCPTPRTLAESTDIIITMLADDNASQAVHFGDDGLFAADTGATVLLEMGTLSPTHIGQLSDAAGDRRIVDAPVSGSIDAARAADLMIMVGADETTVAEIAPVLDAIGRKTICLGHTGTGATMKLVVNLLIHGLNQTVAEALVLAEASGINLADAYEVLESSAAAAPMLHYRKPLYLDEEDNPISFALSLARKDIELALELAATANVPMPQSELNCRQLRAAEHDGFGQRDMASMVSYLRGLK